MRRVVRCCCCRGLVIYYTCKRKKRVVYIRRDYSLDKKGTLTCTRIAVTEKGPECGIK
jgi:hypothetical protein